MRKTIFLFIILPFPLLAASNTGSLAGTFADGNIIFSHLLAFGLGFLASLTPCVLPLVPIVIGIFGAKKGGSVLKNFLLAFVFVQGMATLYTTLGIIAALTGSTFGAHNSNAFFNVIIAGIFIYLALVFSGYTYIKVPLFVQNLNSKTSKSGFIPAYFMGIFSGVLAASCSAPAYFVILEMIRKAAGSGASLVLGISLSYFFSLGMGLIFIAVAVFGLSLPKSGKWQGTIEKGGSIVLFSAAIFYLSHSFSFFKTSYLMKFIIRGGDAYLLPMGYELPAPYFFASILALIFLALCWLLVPSEKEQYSKKGRVKTIAFFFLASVSVYFLADSFNHIEIRGQGKLSWMNNTKIIEKNKIPTNLLIDTMININKSLNAEDKKNKIDLLFNSSTYGKISQLPQKEKTVIKDYFYTLKKKPLLLDFWADWCASCKELEKNILKHPKIAKELKHYYLIRVDVTHDGKMEKDLQKRFFVAGLPTLAFINKKGEILYKKFLKGSHISVNRFLQNLKNLQ